MATCKACGAELKPGAKFCENCGARVEVTPTPPAPNPAPAAPAQPTASAPVQSNPTPATPKPATPPPTPPKTPIYTASTPAQPSPEKKPFDKRLLAIPAAIIAVLVIIAAFLLGKGSGKPAESTVATPAPASSEAAKPTEAPAAKPTGSDAGIYLVASLEDEGASMTRDELEAMGMGDWYVELCEDGTGEFYTGEISTLTWKDGKMTITDAGQEMDFIREGDTLSFEDTASGFTMKFTRTDAKPDITASASALTDGGEADGNLYPFDGGNSYDQLLNTTWYGWIRYEHYDGFDSRDYFDTDTYDCWGYIEENSACETYFEVYQDGLPDDPVISMWVKVYDDHIEPVLGSDSWILDTAIPQEESYNFSIYPVNDSIRLLWYPYENDEGQSCSVSFFMRLDGTEWDEANDELPPRYAEYKAALGQ